MLNFVTCTQTFVNARMSLNMVHSILHLRTLVLPISLSQKSFWIASSAASSSSVMSISSIMLRAVSKGIGAAREPGDTSSVRWSLQFSMISMSFFFLILAFEFSEK